FKRTTKTQRAQRIFLLFVFFVSLWLIGGKVKAQIVTVLFLPILLALNAQAQTANSSDVPPIREVITVTPARIELPLSETASSVDIIEKRQIEQSPSRTLDDLLRQIPGFSLLRRTSSLVAHPTTQGASLRGLSTNGASRTLILLDNVPLNDPF